MFYTVEKRRESLIVLNDNFTKVLGEYNDSLLGFNKYSFDFKEINVKDVFGCFNSTKEKFDSTILDTDQLNQLINLCEFPASQKWELKYRASRDGFKSTDFHTKCNGIANTFTVIKTTSGNIFGGFTEKAWNSNNQWIGDPKAMIFSLVNKENKPFKASCSNQDENAICCFKDLGTTFGYKPGKKDIYIAPDSNENQVSHSYFGLLYHHPDYQHGTEKAKSILAGSFNFQTIDIEVFSKIK